MLTKLFHLGYFVLVISLLLISGITAVSVFGLGKGTRIFAVQSGSMEPAIKTGSVLLIVPSSDYTRGDVIAFLTSPGGNPRTPGAVVTHRIYSIVTAGGPKTITTKGDANYAPDIETITPDQVLGKAVLTVPYLGYAVNFLKTQLGFTLLVVIPATVFCYSEIQNISLEIKKLIKKKKNLSPSLSQKDAEKQPEKTLEIKNLLEL